MEVRSSQQIVDRALQNLSLTADVSLVQPFATHGDDVAATILSSDHPEVRVTESDAVLIARIRGGEPIAARHFYERHADRVYRTAWRVLRDRNEAEDVTQDVFVRALGSLDQVRDTTVVGAWLSAIAARSAYDTLRTRRRQALRFVPLDAAQRAATAPAADPLVGDHVAQAIARLSSKLQLVLVMYELEGYSHAEIAAALQIPVATSKTRLFQARAVLREELAAYAPRENTHE